MLSLTRIAQFHGYLYEALGEDKRRTLMRLEHKVAVSVATAGSSMQDVVKRTAVLARVVDEYFASRLHEYLIIRANEPASANYYMQNRTSFRGLYISAGDNSSKSLSQELLRSALKHQLYDERFLLYRILVRRSDQDAQYMTIGLDEAISTYVFGIEADVGNPEEQLKKMLRPVGEEITATKGRSRYFKGRSCALKPPDKRLF